MTGGSEGPAEDRTAPGSNPEHSSSWDEALARLEDTLLSYPYGRALPDLATILREAGISEDFLRSDDRAAKVLHEAIMARPLSSTDSVRQLKTEVELLTLEVEVLTDRLRDPVTSTAEARRVTARLGEVRQRLESLQDDL